MTLTALHPFLEALKLHRGRAILPTSLGSAELAQLDAALKRQSLFSARTALEDLLEGYRRDIASIINPVQVRRADRVTPENPEGWVTEGLDPATARLRAKELLQKIGYQPGEGERGTIKDLSSDPRIDLVIKTNVELAQGAGHFLRANDPAVVDEFPAQELVRFEDRKDPRDWPQRWRIAAAVANDPDAARVLEFTGRMVALKSSGIWQALGDGAGGYDDTLGNPYPPFAFRSGMWTQDIDRDEAEALGVIRPDEPAAPARLPDLDALFGAGPAARAYHAPVTNRRGARLANNFNPLQPRDAFGRWVDEDSPEAVLEERDNIRRGNRVVQWVLRHRADLDRGMYRREIGRISFKWGNPGDKANNYRGGAGISHILAKHGERAVRALPVVLAKGLIQDHPEGPDKRLVTYKGFVSSLAKTGSRRSWVITGFKPRRQVGA